MHFSSLFFLFLHFVDIYVVATFEEEKKSEKKKSSFFSLFAGGLTSTSAETTMK
jgi:hypothetical protein